MLHILPFTIEKEGVRELLKQTPQLSLHISQFVVTCEQNNKKTTRGVTFF